MRNALLICAILCLVVVGSASASTAISGVGVHSAPTTNCGFDVNGTTAGWLRFHLVNDLPATPGRDIWVLPGNHYPLDVADVEFFTVGQGGSPSSITFDDSQACGYTRSYLWDECDGSALPYNLGFYSGAQGSVTVHTADNADRETQARVHLGLLWPYSIVSCELIEDDPVTYLVGVAP